MMAKKVYGKALVIIAKFIILHILNQRLNYWKDHGIRGKFVYDWREKIQKKLNLARDYHGGLAVVRYKQEVDPGLGQVVYLRP